MAPISKFQKIIVSAETVWGNTHGNYCGQYKNSILYCVQIYFLQNSEVFEDLALSELGT